MDVKLSANPILSDDNNNALYTYLRDVSFESPFATSVLQVLIDERCSAHRSRWNSGRAAKNFAIGDVVKAHVQVQSNSSTGTVKKLSYQARGPFQIKEKLDGDSYLVQRYGDDDAATRKYKGSELYLLPPNIFPHKPIDSMNQRYLNFSHAPAVSPFKKSLKIEMYNNTYFPSHSKYISNPSLDQPSSYIDQSSFTPHTNMPSATTLLDDSTVTPPLIETSNIPEPTALPSQLDINTLSNSLFFIHYTPTDTMRRRWYLVQIDTESTIGVNPSWESNAQFWCVFLARHPQDNAKSDEFSRWWPEWYKYTRCQQSNEIVYGDRVLIRPSTNPDSSKFLQWTALLPLHGPKAVTLIGPFHFEKVDTSNRVRHKVHHDEWRKLLSACKSNNILPPTLGTNYNHKISRK